MEPADGFVEINQAECDDRQRNDWQPKPRCGVGDEFDFLLGNARGLDENVHAIEADPGDVREAGRRVHAGLLERAVDDAKLHGGGLTEGRRNKRKVFNGHDWR